jgi:hypothetical protein
LCFTEHLAVQIDPPVDVTKWAGTAVVAGAIPAAAADAAGGLPVSDAGGLDLDAKLANTNEVTAARMGALTDWLLDAIKVVTDAIGATGSGLSAIPWNAAWDAEVESEVNDALVALKLDHLIAVADADDVVDDSILAKLASKAADWSTYDNTIDSLEQLADSAASRFTALGIALNAIIADTVDIQSRLPAALIDGLMVSDMYAVHGSSVAAATIEKLYDGAVLSGVVNDAAATSTSFKTTLDALGFSANDIFNDAAISFYNGNLQGQTRRILDYADTDGVVTVLIAFSEAPGNGDAFVILGRIE